MGSRKFGNFMFLSWGLTTLSQVAFVATASSIGISLAPEPGPFFYIFSLIPFYYSTYAVVEIDRISDLIEYMYVLLIQNMCQRFPKHIIKCSLYLYLRRHGYMLLACNWHLAMT